VFKDDPTFTRFGGLGHLAYGIMAKHLPMNKNQQVIVLNDVLNIKTSNKLFGHVKRLDILSMNHCDF
jgi:hypothetical protein